MFHANEETIREQVFFFSTGELPFGISTQPLQVLIHLMYSCWRERGSKDECMDKGRAQTFAKDT